jgi:hypothetical protein
MQDRINQTKKKKKKIKKFSRLYKKQTIIVHGKILQPRTFGILHKYIRKAIKLINKPKHANTKVDIQTDVSPLNCCRDAKSLLRTSAEATIVPINAGYKQNKMKCYFKKQ